MCLTINTDVHTKKTWNTDFKRIPKPLVADKDIPCIKWLISYPLRRYGFMTPYQRVGVEFDENGIVELVSDVKSKRLPFSVFSVVDYRGRKINIVEKGIHSWHWKRKSILSYPAYGKRDPIFTEFRAVIPKGAKYYVGEDNDLVSNRLLIFENEDAYYKYMSDKGLVRDLQ